MLKTAKKIFNINFLDNFIFNNELTQLLNCLISTIFKIKHETYSITSQIIKPR
jgi:hypothetical protein